MAQQIQQAVIQGVVKSAKVVAKDPPNCRINGSQTKIEPEFPESGVLQLTQAEFNSVISQRNNAKTPQPIPPPLAPLSSGTKPKPIARINSDSIGLINDDSNSLGNISIASNSGVSSNPVPMDDGESSLTSFEGLLLNGIPNSLDIDAPLSEDSNSNISNTKPRSLMLADLLEKKIDKKEPPAMNGVLRIGDKGLELVENHIEKVLMTKENTFVQDGSKVSVIVDNEVYQNEENNLKRPAGDDPEDVQVKRPHLSSVIVSNTNINGTAEIINDNMDSPEDGDREIGSVSSTAANLYAALAADVLDDEELEEEIPEIPQPIIQQQQLQPQFQQIIQQNIQQNKVINSSAPSPSPQPQQQIIMHAANRQIIVSQPQVINSSSGPMYITAGIFFF